MKRLLIGMLLGLFATYSGATVIPTGNQVGAANMPDEIAPICAPFDMPQLKRPEFPDRTVNIASRGAKSGRLCTKIIQKAIDELEKKGGGTVVIPAGHWLTGRIILKSNINLHLEENAALRFSGEIKDYLPVVLTRNEGIDMYSLGALIYANQADNIALTGKGKLLGPSKDCEMYRKHMQEQSIDEFISNNFPLKERIYDGAEGNTLFLPMFFSPIHCTNVLVEGVTFEETIFWNVVPVYCDRVIIRGVTVNSVGTPRGDGIDIDSSRNVLIEYSTLDCGDDCFTIKSGRGEDGLFVNRPSENIVIRHCLAQRGPGGLTCGSETAGMIRNVYMHDCVFENVHNGFYFKTRRSRGGGGEDMYFERIRLVAPNVAFRWDMLGSQRWVGDLAKRLPVRSVEPLTPFYRHISIKDIIIENCRQLIDCTGIPESPLSEVTIVRMEAKCQNLIKIQDVDGLVIANSFIQVEKPDISVVDGRNLIFIDVKLETSSEVQTVYSGELCRPIMHTQ